MGTEACNPNSAQKYATGRLRDSGYDVANQVPPDVASCAAAAATSSYSRRNAGSAAQAASRSGATRRNSSMGLCWVRRHSAGSSMRNSARALRFQLHDRFLATAASPVMRSGRLGRVEAEVVAPERRVMTRKLTRFGRLVLRHQEGHEW